MPNSSGCKFEAVLFDLDGTLLDHLRAERDAALAFRAGEPTLHSIEPERFVPLWLECSRIYSDRYRRGELSFSEQRICRMQEVFAAAGVVLSPGEAEREFGAYLAHYESSWKLFPEVMGVLRELNRYAKIGIITNGDSAQQRRKLERTGLAALVDSVTISGEVGAMKPDMRIFTHALSDLGTAAERTALLGDVEEIDVQPALRLGIFAALVRRKSDESTGRLGDFPVVSSVSEFAALLGR